MYYSTVHVAYIFITGVINRYILLVISYGKKKVISKCTGALVYIVMSYTVST
jgi:hypothetical protein